MGKSTSREILHYDDGTKPYPLKTLKIKLKGIVNLTSLLISWLDLYGSSKSDIGRISIFIMDKHILNLEI